MKDEDYWIHKSPKSKKLLLRFRVRGFSKQFYLSTGLKDSKRNREIVRSKRDAIANDIALERFDSSLEKYRFRPADKTVAAVTIATASTKHSYNLSELWEKFTDFQATHLEQSTIQGTYKKIGNIISQLPTQKLDDAPLIRDWLLKHFSYYTAWESLAAYKRCCRWIQDSGIIASNPFEKVQIPKPKNRSNEDEGKAYTLEQRDLIIKVFETHPKFSHYSSFVKFLFWTGCRPGEAYALTWGDVNGNCTRISITKAYASRVHVTKGTKNNRRRVFPCSQGSKLQSLLLQLKPHSPVLKELIFKSKSGQKMNSRISDQFWKNHTVKEYYYSGVVEELAERGIVPYLSLYSTRHTFATWAIASGASPEKVAYWLGDDIQTVLKYYCHPDVTKAECPDF